MTIGLLLVLLLVLAAEFTNGLTDAANAIATVVGTRVLSPMRAVFMAAVLNMAGVLITGAAVAATIGTGIVRPEAISLGTVAAAMLTVVVWTMAAWFYGIPTSETHELLAGLAGAGLAYAGPSVLLGEGWLKVLLGLGFSTIIGFGLAFLVMVAIYWIFRTVSRARSKRVFSRAQVVSAAFMAFSHGSNDGQKFMGVFTLALLLGGSIDSFAVPLWVMLLCGFVMALGTALGGWRIIRTMGSKITRLEPAQGFAAETAASVAILTASRFGIPLSTTHTIGTAIMGVGATRRFSAVNWSVSRQIVNTWVLTFPACLILGYGFALVFKAF
ncbi:MAG: phosphate transporter [Actinobacteria bacterium RBG_16_67_15]|nr:MAG: phosphate transporter [Actinobacteria bacterium RBG_16_67_15]